VRGSGRLAVLFGCVAIALAAAWYAGAQFAPPEPRPAAGSVRLGPEPGEELTAYLDRLPDELPPPGAAAPALVQFGGEVTGAAAAAATAGTDRLTAVWRVPLPRVQTALRFQPLDPGVEAGAALDVTRQRAALAAGADAQRLAGRPGDVAAAEAAALSDPACPCVLAVLVEADRSTLESVAGRPQVRALHAAPPGAEPVELALAPLLPGQTERAEPVPDDGPVAPR
jgi:hypothetical protein